MEKNANTFFPNDRVTIAEPGTKKASPDEVGKVTNMNPDTNTAWVQFDDGSSRAVDVNKLTKV